jgi:hypothetical protein
VGALAHQLWSVEGDEQSTLLLQYFVSYNLAGGWYLTSSPTLTADWDAPSGQRWVVPFGGGFGKVFRIGTLPFDGSLTAYANAVKPDVGPDWTLRGRIALLLPR